MKPEFTAAMHDFVDRSVVEIEATLLVGAVGTFPDLPRDQQFALMATILAIVIDRLELPLSALVLVDEDATT
jgi:hypothetical protein